MRHRPQREKYPPGAYGDWDYIESLERYTTYLENRMKEKLYIIDAEKGEDVSQLVIFAKNGASAFKKVKKNFPEYDPMIIDSEIDLSFACS